MRGWAGTEIENFVILEKGYDSELVGGNGLYIWRYQTCGGVNPLSPRIGSPLVRIVRGGSYGHGIGPRTLL